ncbi:MAG: hypothetical protein Q6L49_10095 [Thermostichales cyanobacterium HHBFW_bins_127]
MAFPVLTTLGIILWAGLWAYATLLVIDVILEETDSLYRYPMRLSLDRFVEQVGLPWLKQLHRLPLPERRPFSIGLLLVVTLATALFFAG